MKSHFREKKVFGGAEPVPVSFFRAASPTPELQDKTPGGAAVALRLDSAADLAVRVLSGEEPKLPSALARAVRRALSTYHRSGESLEALQRKALALPTEEKRARVLQAVADGQWIALL